MHQTCTFLSSCLSSIQYLHREDIVSPSHLIISAVYQRHQRSDQHHKATDRVRSLRSERNPLLQLNVNVEPHKHNLLCVLHMMFEGRKQAGHGLIVIESRYLACSCNESVLCCKQLACSKGQSLPFTTGSRSSEL